MILRQSKALAHYLDNRTLYVLKDERIIGNIASESCSLITFSVKWSGWLDKAIEGNLDGRIA